MEATEKKQTYQLAWWDFTIPEHASNRAEIKKHLEMIAKKWVFQLELGSEGEYRHFQGRLSLKVKKRMSQMIKIKWCEIHWNITSTNCMNKNSFSYVMKDDGRIEGPWSDKDEEQYIPRQYRGKLKSLRPFQKHIWDTRNNFCDRTVNIIFNERGNLGKTVIAALCELFGRGIDLPVCNDGTALIQAMCDICKGRKLRNPSPVFIDIPRAFNQERMNGIYTAIETIKKGKLYDMRYHYKCWWIDSPVIWVMTNQEQNLEYLSRDRWKIWTINENLELVKYQAKLIEFQ